MTTWNKTKKSALPPLSPAISAAVGEPANRQNSVNSDYSKLSEDGKILLALIDQRFDEMRATIELKDKKINDLEEQVCSMKHDMDALQKKIDDLDADGRSSTVIVSGSSLPSVMNDENPVAVVCEVLKRDLKYEISPDNVVAGYRLGKRTDKPSILLNLRRRDIKNDLLRACKTVKPPNLYMNESLVPRRAHILYLLRRAKRRYTEISACGSTNGRIYAYRRSTASSEKNL